MKLTPLGELSKIVSGSTPKTSVPDYWNGNIPWVTPADLTNNDSIYFINEPRKITQSGYKSCSTTMLPPGSILFSSRAPIGHCAITTYPLCTNQGFKSIVPNDKLDSLYGYFALRHFTPQIVAMGRGATFGEVTKDIIEDFCIPLPPLEEQQRIATLLSEADLARRVRRYAQGLSDDFLQEVFIRIFGDPVTNPMGWKIEPFGQYIIGMRNGLSPSSTGTLTGKVLTLSAITGKRFRPEKAKVANFDISFPNYGLQKSDFSNFAEEMGISI